jgi:hypothetical protein
LKYEIKYKDSNGSFKQYHDEQVAIDLRNDVMKFKTDKVIKEQYFYVISFDNVLRYMVEALYIPVNMEIYAIAPEFIEKDKLYHSVKFDVNKTELAWPIPEYVDKDEIDNSDVTVEVLNLDRRYMTYDKKE